MRLIPAVLRFAVLGFTLLTVNSCSAVPIVQPGTVHCVDRDDVDADLWREIVSASQESVRFLAGADVDAAVERFHPEIRDQLDRQQIGGLHTVLADIVTPNTTLVPDEGYLITAKGARQLTALCGAIDPKDETHRIVQLGAPPGRMSLVMLKSTDLRINFRLTVQLREREGAWDLWGTHFGLAEIDSMGGVDFEERADTLIAEGNMVAAWLYLGVAQQLEIRAPYIATGSMNRIMERVNRMRVDPMFEDALLDWGEDPHRIDVHHLAARILRTELAIDAYYVTDQPLNQESIEPEARRIGAFMQQTFPILRESFDGVIVRAFHEPPLDPNRQYQSFYVGVDFEAAPPQSN